MGIPILPLAPTGPTGPTEPFGSGGAPDKVEYISPAIEPYGPPLTISNAGFTAGRVYASDAETEAAFEAFRSRPHTPEEAWNFVYDHILYLYDLLYPVMNAVFALYERQTVENNASSILTRVNVDQLLSTAYMPITRDLTAVKRTILRSWCQYVLNGYEWPDASITIDPP